MTIAALKTRLPRLPDWGWLLVIALGLRLFRLNAESLWYDESGTAWISKLTFPHMLATLRAYDVHPPLWYSIVWVIEHTLGDFEFLLRLPAAIFGTIAVILMWRIARQLGFEPRTAFVVGLIAAVFPGILYYSQEARMYPLLLCALLATILAALSNGWLWFALSGLVVVYSHNLGLIYIGVISAMVLLLRLPQQRPLKIAEVVRVWRAPILAMAAIGIGWLPWAPTALYQISAVKKGFWVDPLSPVGLIDPFIQLTMGSRSSLAIDIGAYAAALGMTVVAVYLSRQWLLKRNGLLILATMLGLPLLFALISWLWTPIFIARSMAGAIYLLALPWAYFLCHAKKRDQQLAALIVLPMLVVTLVAEYFPNRMGRDPVQAHMAPIVAAWQPGDIGYFTSFWTATVDQYYVRKPYAVRPNAADGAFWHPQITGLGDLMEFNQSPFNQLRSQGYKRAWLMLSLSALSDPAEPDHIAQILDNYPHRLVSYYTAEDGSDNSVYIVNLYPEF